MQILATNPPESRRITIMAMNRHVTRNVNIFFPSNAQSSANANSKFIAVNFLLMVVGLHD